MGLFKDLLKGAIKDSVRDAENREIDRALGNVFRGNTYDAGHISQTGSVGSAAPSQTTYKEGPWSDRMPNEPNQFNSGLSYVDYFAKIFAEDFPSYVLYQEPGSAKNSTVISLTDPAGRKALVVELISRRSSPDKVRSNCKAQGIPYLRFYYDYSENGWWNVRSYVVARVSKALGLQ